MAKVWGCLADLQGSGNQKRKEEERMEEGVKCYHPVQWGLGNQEQEGERVRGTAANLGCHWKRGQGVVGRKMVSAAARQGGEEKAAAAVCTCM
eukprot:453532-Pelagomonas_calceolata.AAC.1